MASSNLDLTAFLRSGQFSDMTLVCAGGKEFKVHRLVMCSMSPVLAAAMAGPYEVSLTST